MRIAGIVVSVLVLVLVGLWVAFVRAPSPERVCQHKIDITLAEAGGQHEAAMGNLLDSLHAQCVKEKLKLLQLRGKIVYARQAKCIMAATTLSESERCG